MISRFQKAVPTLFLLSALALPAFAAEYFVSPTGSPSGNGSQANPWSLATAFAHPAAVKPGDTIWVMGGSYKGNFVSRLRGTASSPIIVRSYQNQRAILESDGWPLSNYILEVHGSGTWFWGLELMGTRQTRGGERNGGLNVFGPYMKFINMVIHDTGGIGVWNGSDNTEMYGTIIFDNGYEGGDRGHGHSFYSQNKNGTKRFVDNIYFNAFSHGIHMYGSESAWLDNYHLEGNIGFNNGIISDSGITTNILIGGGNTANNYQVLDNVTFFTPNAKGYGRAAYFGYNGARCNNFNIRGNTFAGSPVGLIMGCTNTTMEGNTVVGTTSGFSQAAYPNNTYLTSNTNGRTKVYIRPNRYERGRGHVAVLNWAGLGSISLDLSSILSPGDNFEIIDAQDYFGAPVYSGTFQGAPVGVTLLNTSVYRSFNLRYVPVHTPSIFNAFVVRRTSGAQAAPAFRAPAASAGPNLTITLPASASLNGSVLDAGYPVGTMTTAWSKASGPGTVTFANAGSTTTTASFSTAGTYVLTLSVNNGTLGGSSNLTVTVNPAPAPADPKPATGGSSSSSSSSSGGTANPGGGTSTGGGNAAPADLKPPPPPSSGAIGGPLRINAGGASYAERSGILWLADQYFTGGTVFNTTGSIIFSPDAPLFTSQRQGNFTYKIPVKNGLWALQLSFAELEFTSANKRLFDVYINGVLQSKNYDVVARSGAARVALNQGFTLDVKNGYVEVKFVGVVGSAILNRLQLIPVKLY